MTDLDSLAAAFSRVWGSDPSTVDLVAFAAAASPGTAALAGPAGPVTFAQLDTQVSATAKVFAAQGLDPDAAVGAAVTPTLLTSGVAPENLAVESQSAVAAIRELALATARTSDLGSLPGIFASVAARFPDRVAVTDTLGTSLTYAELDRRSDELAAGLIEAGAGPEQLVGIALPRTAELIVALVGVTKTGAAYLPLDRSHPVERLSMVVEDARPVVVLADEEAIADLAALDARLVTVAEQSERATDTGRNSIPARVDSRHPAYVMYTSGSTGVPKGVVVTHADVVTLLSAMGREYDYSPDDVWTMFQSYAFDVSVGEIWVALSWGGRLVVLDYLTTRTPDEFVHVLERERVTVVNLTPSAFYQLAGALREPSPGRLSPSVRSMIFVGEALDFAQVRRWFADRQRHDGNSGPQLNNMYGPTEATVYLTRRELTPEFVAQTMGSDIGGPLSSSRMYVLDARLAKAPDGVPGDLYLAGDQLARGYRGRFGLNATRFVADPFGEPGDRMYQSGDVAIVRNGSLEFLGRSDSQVKLRGFRIELGEVEAALLTVDGVNEAAAAIKSRDGFPDQLVGYVVVGGDAEPDPVAMRSAVATKVPDYMVPDIIVALDNLPLNVNGKLDRRALPEPVFASTVEFVAPEGETETVLARIFAEVLGIDEISVIQSIFDMGGNSLLAARIVGRACEELGVDLNLRDLFGAPTVRALAERSRHVDAGLPPITPASPRPQHIPLSYAQSRMWFINRLDPESAAYNIPIALRIVGDLDIDALRSAAADTVRRHEVLRTVFGDRDDQPVQIIAPADSVDDRLDWQDCSSYEEVVGSVAVGFDLSQQWPLRLRLWAREPGEADGAGSGSSGAESSGAEREYVLVVVAHHIAADGESMAPLVRDMLTAYLHRAGGGPGALAELPVQVADFAIWQHEVFGSPDDETSIIGGQLAFWTDALRGLPDVINLPADRPRPTVATGQGAQVAFDIPAAVGHRIDAIAHEYGVTAFMVVHAALAVLLARLSSTSDIAISTPIAGRGQAALDDLVGMFVNTLVLRTDVEPGMAFVDVLAQVGAKDLDAFAHADVPFETVVEALSRVRSQAFEPLAQVMLSFNPAGSVHALDTSVAGLQVTELRPDQVAAQRDLTFVVYPESSGWYGSVTYTTDLFDGPTIEAMAARFVTVLDELTADPATAVGDVDVLVPAEREALAGLPAPVTDTVNAGRTLVDIFVRTAGAYPDSPAVTGRGRTISYAELDAGSSALAAELVALGVRPGDLVGVATRRSPDLVVAIVGVLKTGAAYLPLDLTNPVGRLTHILTDSGVGVVITDEVTNEHEVWAEIGRDLTRVDVATQARLSSSPDTATFVPVRVPADARAYVIYTSGSTGLPKGVELPHRDAVTLLDAAADDFEFRSDDVWSLFHSYAFDFSVWELWGAFYSGGRCVIIDRDIARDPDSFLELIDDEGVTVLSQTPSAFYQLIDARRRADRGRHRARMLQSLRYVVFGGEALSFDHIRRWFVEFPDDTARLINMYGITETTVHSTFRALDPGTIDTDASMIGRPLTSLGIHILDGRLQPTAEGVPGEIYVTGGQLAQSYLGRAALTATRFVADPNGSGTRMYRSGDLARRVAGDIEYLGRSDTQVQLRGFRIEYGEVESGLRSIHGVVEAAARIVDAPVVGQQLVGYVVADAGVRLDPSDVRDLVGRQVPAYMVPSVVQIVDALPLTPNGKLDRNALPEPDFGSGEAEFTGPASAAESLVADAFADILGVDRMSVTDSFFDLGGHSLSAARLAARVGEVLGVTVAIRDVFDAPSPRQLVAAVTGNTSSLPPVVAVVPRPERIPLSFAQQRMWFINRYDPSQWTYNIPAVVAVSGAVDIAALESAIRDIVLRHEQLRTVFPSWDGVPYQSVCDADDFDSRDVWRTVGTEAELFDALTEGFDVTTQWPIRVRLWHESDTSAKLAVVLHHIAADGESMKPLVGDMIASYGARAEGYAPAFAPLEVTFADYAIWQHDVLGSPESPDSPIGSQLGYWREQLAGVPDVLELPADRERPRVPSNVGAWSGVTIPAALAQRVVAVARECGVTPFMVMHGALAVLLSRLSATSDISVATPIAGRGAENLDGVVGMLVNTLVLRTQVGAGMSFKELLAQVREVDLDAFAHADVPFETVVDAVNPVRSESFSPLAQVALSFDPAAGVVGGEITVAGVTFASPDSPVVSAQVDLSLVVRTADSGEDWSAWFIYATDLFDASTADFFGSALLNLIDGLSADPAAAVGDAPMLGGGELEAVLDASTGAVRPIPAGTVADALVAQIVRTPELSALWFEGRGVSYAELSARTSVLARELISAGVGPDVAVGVCIDRSIEMVVAIHAVVAAGGQYVPIATDAPADRVQYMLDTAGVGVVLVTDKSSHVVSRLVANAPHTSTGEGNAPHTSTGEGNAPHSLTADNSVVEVPRAQASGLETSQAESVRTIVVDCAGEVDLSTPPVTDAERLAPLSLDNALYTLFTSGSTGRPKGVTVSHRAVLNRLWWGLDVFPWSAGDRVIQKTPFTFDVSVPELFAPLFTGAELVIARPGGHADPAYIADLIAETAATSVHFVPSMLSVFVDVVDRERLAQLTSLKWVFASGEALPAAVVERVHEIWPNVGIHNLFGPTEAAVEVSWADVSDAPETVTIGIPVWNTETLVLDDRLRPVPTGVPGELYLGGVQVARGYAAQPGLTAERFIPDPYGEPGSRLYRTGDLVRWNASGEIEYLGRTDFQVKLRGQRIELGEIEAVLAAAPGVVHAAATVAATDTGAEHLVAYLAPVDVDLTSVKEAVGQALPSYMVPSVWTLLDEVPLNSAGKLDRRALPEPDFATMFADFVAPATHSESAVAVVFAELLGLEQVSVTESFFDVGGNSLSAMRLAARASDVLGVSVSVRDVFEAPTVRELIDVTSGHAAKLAPIVAVSPRPERIPLSFAQQRMWFINQFDPSQPTYNLPAALRLIGSIDAEALRQAVIDVVDRHEILRTSFPADNGQPYQLIGDTAEFDGRGIWQIAESEAEVFDTFATGFDVSTEWPLRVRLLRVADGESLLAVLTHHIGSDGESLRPLIADIIAAYSARVQGEAPQWRRLDVQFADFSIWQHEVLGSANDPESVIGRQLAYWRAQLAGVPDVIELPTDRPRPAVASHRGAHLDVELPAAVADKISVLAADRGMTPFMVAQAALAVLMARLSGAEDITVATPIAGRGQAVLDPLIGMFVNTLVLRTPIDPNESFAELLDKVRRVDLDAFAHGDAPFETVVEALDPVRSEAFSPLAQVILSFDPAASAGAMQVPVGDVAIAPAAVPTVSSQMDLTIAVSTAQPAAPWPVSVIYATDLFDESTVRTLMDRFTRALDTLTGDTDTAVGDIDILTPAERAGLLAGSAGSEAAIGEPTVDLIVAAMSATPDAVALWSGDRTVTYAEFGARVATLARTLIAEGVGPDAAVGVAVDRSVELLVAIHAVAAAGGQYVPIATDTPADRLRYMTDTAGVRIILVADSVGDVATAHDGRSLVVDCSGEVDLATPPVTDAERLAPIGPDTAAYTLFTSGSTGRPKGVTVSHAALANRLSWMREWYHLDGGDIFIQKTPVTFDVSVWELFLPFVIGAPLVIAEPGGHGDADYLAELIDARRVSVIHFVPSMLAAFVDALGARRLAALTSLRMVFTSGEALTHRAAQELLDALPTTRLVNLYGPTEAAVDVTAYEVRRGDAVIPIGVPVPNTTTLVLDDRLRPVPIGVPGELYLGGVQVARGYAGRSVLTAERFVADPYGAPGSRLYRTGDLVRWDRAGDIEYIGRSDFQVKLRGQRLELGEVEAVLAGAPSVVHAAARVVKTPSGAEHLVGYLAPAGVDSDAVRAAAALSLPEYMLPTVWVALADIPLNAAGKLDRKALPDPDFGSVGDDFAAPLGAVEELLASIVGGLVGVERVSVTESFFALGGDSIMSIQLASAARAAGFDLSPRQVFEHRTVRAMAAAITEIGARLPELAEPEGGGAGPMPLPPVVAWMLEHSDAPAEYADFNQSATLAAPAALTTTILAELLDRLVGRHPMLSARVADREVVAGNGFDTQSAVTAMASEYPAGTADFDADLAAAHAAAAGRLDPSTGSLVHAVLVTDPAGTGRVVLVIHHLGVDTVSWQAIIEDLITLWSQHAAGRPYHLRATTSSQRAWVDALAERADSRADELPFWLPRLPERPTDFGARLDRARDRRHSAVGVTRQLGAELTEAILTSVPESFGGKTSTVTVADILLGGLARAVRSWQHGRGIIDSAPISVLVEGHGRYEESLESGADPVRADLSRSVGWFTSVAPQSLDPASDMVHAVKAAKEERLAQPDSGIGFGLLRYGGTAAELAGRPLPSILFNYLGAGRASVTTGDPLPFTGVGAPAFEPSPAGGMTAFAALDVSVGVTTGADGDRRLNVIASAPRAILSEADLGDLIGRWTAELADVADAVAQAAPGLSPSDVPGVDLTQADLDELAHRYPGADVWAPAPLQRGLYFQAELGHASAGDAAVDVYLTQAVLHLDGEADVDRLRAAVADLVAHHRVLRSGFVRTRGGSLVAVIHPDVEVPWEVVDLGDVAGAQARARIDAIGTQQKVVPFDLAAPPLLRVVLVRHGDGIGVVITNHHILFDGWSGPLVLADLLALYATGSTYTRAAAGTDADFADFLAAVAAKDHEAGLAAWRAVVARADGATLVAPGIEATADSMPRKHAVTLDPDVVTGLESMAREHSSTIASVLQLAWAILLSRITGNRVVTFGETVSGRPADLPGAETMVGLFINTLPVVVDVDPDAKVGALLERLQADKVAVLDHQYLTLPEILAAADVAAGFDTLTIHESYPVDADSLSSTDTGDLGGLRILDVETSDATHYPLNMVTAPTLDGVSVALKYLPGAFADDQIEVFADALVQILGAIASGAGQVCGDIGLLDEAGLAAVAAAEWGEQVTAASDTTLEVPVFAQAARTPDAVALWFEGREVSYREFTAWVSVLARDLVSMGVGPDVAVALCIPRSVELMVAIHAVVAAGGQYVPIGLGTPAERVQYMVDTAGVGLVLVTDTTASSFAEVRGAQSAEVRGARSAGVETAQAGGIGTHLVDCSGVVDEWTPMFTAAERLAPVSPDNAAYTLFTSGSTGRPKGVTLSHRAVLNRLWWGLDELPIDGTDTVILKTPYTFDVSVPELFAPLMVGARVVILKDGGHMEPLYVAEVIERTRATMVHFVPSMLSVFVDVVGSERMSRMDSVRIISMTGEAVPPAVAAQVRQALPGILFYNLYGPTEAAIEITAEKIERVSASDASVPIGVPIWNSSSLVLDARLQRVPAGVPGELYLGGVQLARGYAARGDLTADRFIADPCGEPGSRMYRTGDLVRRRTDGVLEYLGRTDFQVKLRGQRVELGEIESAIASAPGVVHAAATVLETPAGDQHLIGYFSPSGIDDEVVRASVAGSLPVYMVPTVWVGIDDVVLNSAGKLDRKALPQPDFDAVEAEFVAADTPTEVALAAIFADVLGVERVGVTTSFFDLGGNSLSAMKLAALAGDSLGVEIGVRDLFDAPSVRALAAASAGKTARRTPLVPYPRPDRLPLSATQRRMWVINQFDPASPAYNIVLPVRFTGPIDPAALRASLVDVGDRHEVLRTVYPSDDLGPFQQILDRDDVDTRLDWESVGAREQMLAAAGSGFDVSSRLPLRARIRVDAAGATEVLIVVHHIAFDGESTRVLVRDLIAAYQDRVHGRGPGWDPLPVQYADYVLWQAEVLGDIRDRTSELGRQFDYWTGQLAGVPEVTDLPMDRPRPAVADPAAGQLQVTLPDDLAARLPGAAGERNVTAFMMFHAALAVTVSRLATTDDVVIGTPIAGRTDRALSELVGMFVNTLVLRTRVTPATTGAELLAQVRRTDLDAFANADVHFEQLVERFAPQRSASHDPLVQIALLHTAGDLDVGPIPLTELGVTAEPIDIATDEGKGDLAVAVHEGAGSGDGGGPIVATFTYATALFDRSTVERFAQVWQRVLAALVGDPDRAVGDIDIVGPQPGQAQTAPAAPAGDTAVTVAGTLVEQLAARDLDPGHPALIGDGQTLTYADFEARTNRVARSLIARGVRPDDIVEVALDRSADQVVAVWGVIKSGAAFAAAGSRAHAAPPAVLRIAVAGDGDAVTVGDLDDTTLPDGPIGAGERTWSVRPGNLLGCFADLEAESGVVALTHPGVAGLSAAHLVMTGNRHDDPDTRVLYSAEPTDPAAFSQMLAAVGAGHTLVVVPARATPEVLARVLERDKVTDVLVGPTTLDGVPVDAGEYIRNLTVGAGGCTTDLVAAWAARGRRIHNAYTPVEATMWATKARVMPKKPVTLGKPIAGVSAYVLDEEMRQVGKGESGYLYLAGDCLVRGYQREFSRTASGFVADPFGEPGSRMFVTGRRVHVTKSGELAPGDAAS